MSDTAHPAASARPAIPAERLGGELRTRRESLGWQLPELAESLRIRQTYLEAIEAGRIGDLPGTTYALGFVRAYATALGLQGDQVASRFRAEAAVVSTRPALSFPAPVPQRGVPAGALMLLGLLILGGAYGGWYYVTEHQRTPAETVLPIPDRLHPAATRPPPSPQVASILPTAATPAPLPAAPVPATPAAPVSPAPVPVAAASAPTQPKPQATRPAPAVVAAPSPALPSGTRIVLKASADAWVTVKQPGGPAVFNKLMHAGDTWPVPADKAGLLLTTGNAGGTEVDVDGAPTAALGANGTVRRNLKLDPDTLKILPKPSPQG